MEQEFDLDWEGRRCKVAPLGALAARQVGRRLMNVVGQGLKEAGMAGDGASPDIVAAGAILERMDDQTVQFLHDTFAKVTKVEDDPGTDRFVPVTTCIDLAFGGGPGLKRWARWLAFCVEASCGDFFGELRAQAAARRAKALAEALQSRSQSPST